MTRYLLRSVLVLLASLLAACSSFDQQWKNAAHGKTGATRWDGNWTSGTRRNSNGSPHGGRLRCVLEPQRDQSLVAHFHANWLIFSGNYDMTLHPAATGPRRPQAHEYRGTHEMPAAFGGTYHYGATITGDRFTACYTSSYDRGTFLLHPVAAEKEKRESHAEH
jgi:hypothetical protein